MNLELKDAPAGVADFISQCLQAVLNKDENKFTYLITKGLMPNVDIAVVNVPGHHEFHYGYTTVVGAKVRGEIKLNQDEDKFE